jgi:hypothetical protein
VALMPLIGHSVYCKITEGTAVADDLQPWDQPRAVRRSCEPHRADGRKVTP